MARGKPEAGVAGVGWSGRKLSEARACWCFDVAVGALVASRLFFCAADLLCTQERFMAYPVHVHVPQA